MPDVNDLLKQGVEAARSGDREAARKLFDQAIDMDPENIKAWLLLYRVVDNIDEKRICLTSVLQLDPDNQRAQEALDKLDAKATQTKADEEVIPGITRRQLTMIAGGAGGLVVVLILITMVLVISRNNQIAAQEKATRVAMANNTQAAETLAVEQTQKAIEITEEATAAAETLFAITSPTPSLTPTSNLPPTWTPSPAPTDVMAATPLAYPDGVGGIIVGWSGRDVQNNDFLPIVSYSLAAGGVPSRIGDEFGRYVTVDRNGQRVVYARYYTTTFDWGLEAVNLNGTQPEDLGTRWRGLAPSPPLKAEMPVFSGDGSQLVFVGTAPDTLTKQVYLLNMNVQGSNPLIRLTEDNAIYTYPALSPDGSKVAVIRNLPDSPTPGEDIVVIDVGSKGIKAITSDLDSFVEMSPRWSPDGRQIAFASADRNDPKNHEIRIINADGTGSPTEPVPSPQDDIFPIFSPDGRYLAFSSNRGGAYDIFVYDLTTGTLWQVTNTPDEDYPGGWSR